MNTIYLRAYKQKVQAVTYKIALPHHKLFIQYFGYKPLKGITARDCESFRLHIIEHYSENYAKNLWSRFKACMGYADKSTTLNTYSHWFNTLDKTVSEEITQNVISAGLDSILCQNPCQTHN